MQFLVTGYDGTDAEAPARRAAAQRAHRELRYDMIGSRNVLFSMVILNDEEETIGTLQVMQFDTRQELDDWLGYEPYVLDKVWQHVEVSLCRVGPAFEWMTLEPGSVQLDDVDGDVSGGADDGFIRLTDAGNDVDEVDPDAK